MRRKLLMAGFSLAVLLPAAAHAQQTCEQRSQNRTAGTAVGAIAGALLGSAVSGHGHKTDGAVVGGIAGAVVGNQVAKGPKDCQHAYGWYDNGNAWHANNVDPNQAYGYYDNRGEWRDGRPADYQAVQYRQDDRRDNQYDGRRDDHRDNQYRDNQDNGRQAWEDDRFMQGPGYPELRDQEQRIRDHIRQGVRDSRIAPDQARDLMQQLHAIRDDEQRIYRDRGDRLRRDDRYRLQNRLRDLDRRVDRAMRRRRY